MLGEAPQGAIAATAEGGCPHMAWPKPPFPIDLTKVPTSGKSGQKWGTHRFEFFQMLLKRCREAQIASARVGFILGSAAQDWAFGILILRVAA